MFTSVHVHSNHTTYANGTSPKLESTDLSCVGGVMRAFVVFGAVEDRFVGVRGGLPGPVGTSDRFRSV